MGEATEVFAVMVGKQIADLAERHQTHLGAVLLSLALIGFDLERHAAGCHSRRAQAPVIGGLLMFSVVIPRLRAYTANVEPSTPSSHDRVIVAAPIAESNIDQYKF